MTEDRGAWGWGGGGWGSWRVRSRSEIIEDLQHCGQGPGLGLAAEGAVLAVLIGQLWETLPWRPEGAERSHTSTLTGRVKYTSPFNH